MLPNRLSYAARFGKPGSEACDGQRAVTIPGGSESNAIFFELTSCVPIPTSWKERVEVSWVVSNHGTCVLKFPSLSR
jgi:hypothetical protein